MVSWRVGCRKVRSLPALEFGPDGLQVSFEAAAVVDGLPFVGAGERVLRVADDGVAGAFGLHVSLVAFAEDDEALAGVLTGAPDPVVLVAADGFGETVSGAEEVD